MKKYLLGLLLLLCFTACNKMDDSGDLGGLWQLTSWVKKAEPSTTYKDKTSRIFYAFNLGIMKTQNMYHSEFYLSRFSIKGDSLHIGNIYAQPGDALSPIEVLGEYGADATGRFKIDKLTDDNLQLSNSENILTFRKY